MFDGLFCLVVLMVCFVLFSCLLSFVFLNPFYSVLLLYSAMDLVLVSVMNKELNC